MSFRTPWVADDTLVLVVAAGKGAREQAWRFCIYHSHNRRSFRPAKYLAFYCKGVIDTYAVIDGPPEDDVLIAERPELTDLAKIMPESNGDPWAPHCLFRLKDVKGIGPIVNDKESSSGKGVAWTQKQGYTTIHALRSARRTTSL